MRHYVFWVCKKTFIMKEHEKGDTKFYRGQMLMLPEGEMPANSHPEHNFFKKLENFGYQEPLEIEAL